MAKRKDQVIRDLLRKIKRTYKNTFYESTNYLTSEKNSESMHRWLVEFAELKISEIDSEMIAFTLGCLIFPLKMKDMIHKKCFSFIQNNEKQYLSMVKIVQSPFKKFNTRHLKEFVSWGEMATILTHFPMILIPFKLSEDEAVGFGIIEDECMLALNY